MGKALTRHRVTERSWTAGENTGHRAWEGGLRNARALWSALRLPPRRLDEDELSEAVLPFEVVKGSAMNMQRPLRGALDWRMGTATLGAISP